MTRNEEAVWGEFNLYADAEAAGIAPAEMLRRASEALRSYRVHVSGVTRLEEYHRARLEILEAMVAKYASDARGLPQADAEALATEE